ncbi:uncharacterized protein PHACADRAFT_251555 [Phanerochaete carnosa HHB-10118-sp]|uniref:Uncharacterized protein n=1 Tax=Phanerochaete carnosa (strain HHB-10118-sp) TaxID=650164 RepID=K5X4H6_PHACS|nr:uncharacterized protein PHACADRAFT_251555 [Phanerochaete carnosa HHB-10118-sp]EKM57737.1 hypothetical protein PHACADRAFT_251555 [Phanerochaete carnosa HHB-10118-sp]
MEPRTKAHKHDRIAEWVEQQSAMRYSPRSYDPPPRITIPAPSSVSRTGSSSTRTTSFSEQSSAGPSTLKRRAVPPSPSHTNPISMTVAPAPPHEQRTPPFPQSPPGSGYPMAMEVASPRVETPRVSTSYLYESGLHATDGDLGT